MTERGCGAQFRDLMTEKNGKTIKYIKKERGATRSDHETFMQTTQGRNKKLSAGTLPRELRYQYTCQENDAAAGLMYYDARWYDTATGKFMSQDPIGFRAGDENLYRYVKNNPVTFFDPSGLYIMPANAVKYIAGRGSFSKVILEAVDYKKYKKVSDLESRYIAHWDANIKSFTFKDKKDKICHYCDKIGFIQVKKYHLELHGVWDILQREDSNWEVDGGVPYPYPSSQPTPPPITTIPWTSPGKIGMGDQPGRNIYVPLFGSKIITFRQDFETCAVCLEGLEGISTQWHEISGLGITTGYYASLQNMVVYGCVKWFHEFTETSSGSYVSKRNVTATNVGPDNGFKDAVGEHYYVPPKMPHGH
jgi:RHS repeat-associated protein